MILRIDSEIHWFERFEPLYVTFELLSCGQNNENLFIELILMNPICPWIEKKKKTISIYIVCKYSRFNRAFIYFSIFRRSDDFRPMMTLIGSPSKKKKKKGCWCLFFNLTSAGLRKVPSKNFIAYFFLFLITNDMYNMMGVQIYLESIKKKMVSWFFKNY